MNIAVCITEFFLIRSRIEYSQIHRSKRQCSLPLFLQIPTIRGCKPINTACLIMRRIRTTALTPLYSYSGLGEKRKMVKKSFRDW